MKARYLRKCRPGREKESGAVMIEFAIVILVFILLIAGLTDLGHAFFMKQVATNASREGARYGITYKATDKGVRIPPSAFVPSIENYLKNPSTGYLSNAFLPACANPQVSPGGPGYATGDKGANLQVTVTVTKNWIILSSFIPSIGSSIDMQASTTMQCE